MDRLLWDQVDFTENQGLTHRMLKPGDHALFFLGKEKTFSIGSIYLSAQ